DNSFAPRYAMYLSVSPLDPNIVAISRGASPFVSPRSVGVALYDHGIQLANVTDSPFEIIGAITFADSGTELYGYDNETTGYEFYRMKVDGSGVVIQDKTGRLINNFFVNISADSGLIYSSNGSVVDPAQPALAGSYVNANLASAMALDNSG